VLRQIVRRSHVIEMPVCQDDAFKSLGAVRNDEIAAVRRSMAPIRDYD
jgi:hypothetical protein